MDAGEGAAAGAGKTLHNRYCRCIAMYHHLIITHHIDHHQQLLELPVALLEVWRPGAELVVVVRSKFALLSGLVYGLVWYS